MGDQVRGTSPRDTAHASSGPVETRRGVLKTLNLLIGGAIGLVFAIPALRYVLFPVRRKIVSGAGEPVPVVGEGEVPAAGQPPLRVPIVAREQRDAWAVESDVPQGAAWIVRGPDGAVRALSATCPHLGCAVDFDAQAKVFRCPCHTSAFGLDGKRLSGPAKRDMDSLEVEVEEGQVRVKFERYKLDVAGKEKI